MCEKKSYCNRKVDDCLVDLVNEINSDPKYRTLACCCGHGRYPTTIVVKDKQGHIFEWYSKIWLGPRKRNRYYKSDSEGYYFIPEVIDNIKKCAAVLENSDSQRISGSVSVPTLKDGHVYNHATAHEEVRHTEYTKSFTSGCEKNSGETTENV